MILKNKKYTQKTQLLEITNFSCLQGKWHSFEGTGHFPHEMALTQGVISSIAILWGI